MAKLVFPLDFPSLGEAERFVRLLRDVVDVFKVGFELFSSSGPQAVRRLRDAGASSIMLDVKLHDIPATVSRTLKVLSALQVDFVTLHVEPGYSFDTGVRLVGVTVLTSIGDRELRMLGIDLGVEDLVLKKAALAEELGFYGVVCSGREVALVKERFNLRTFVPGVRPTWWSASDDQKRVVTPGQAAAMGADFVIVGRPIRDSEDPLRAAQLVKEELDEAKG